MKQLAQKLKNGEMQILEVAPPVIGPGMVLVRNHYSLISAGTEGSTVTSARKNLLGKAKERPQQVKQVLEVLRQQGPVQTYRAIMKKLDSYSPLGYSSAGEVIDIASNVRGFAVGDLVACAGVGFASHAEIVAVPANLCVKLLHDADLKMAAYNTLGAIALQGIRQADLRFGETCAVIGLCLLGQITCLLLRASGIKVVGIDIDPHMVETASKQCADLAFTRDEIGLPEKIDEFTGGIGVDGVIIAAATHSADPINFAGRIARKKGKVVIVGNVPTGFDRDPYYYRKELEVRMSCSYGPGRYDLNYEEKGIDYPAGYVRWTENRNMQAFQEAVHSGKIDINYLTTHTFDLDNAADAYNLILSKSEPFLGILIKYDLQNKQLIRKIITNTGRATGSVAISFVGAGSYAMSHLLPNIPKDSEIVLKGILTSSGTSSRTVADKFKFEFCTSDENDIFNSSETNTVFIATRHNSHAPYVTTALRAGKNVFVEKPLCLTETELAEIDRIYRQPTANGPQPLLMVGFNRRFSPLIKILKEKIGSGPMAMLYRINAGAIPSESWIQDKEIGGGRIIGEICHFVDLLTHINGSLPERVFASAVPDPLGLSDTLAINLAFSNGSISTISYYANGAKSMAKEYIEIYCTGTIAVLKDFKELEVYGGGSPIRKKLLNQDKGQEGMVKAFVEAVRMGKRAPIDYNEIHAVTVATFKIIESLKSGNSVRLGTAQ
ncbi:MAG TPA: bi-domain-containing oxidoreductase [Dongiaceae bacterium]|nr:bi-domain-containing oxidoreductase [Dongiaceae bacterium]